jgi:predicted phage terminase large subunit-like protein
MDIPDLTPEEWATLSESEQNELLTCLEGMSGGESLRDFIARMSPHHPAPRHLYPIIAELERAQLEPVRVLISLPPGHAKTTLFVNAIAWWLSRHPSDPNGYFSYNSQQAHSKSVLARELAGRAGIKISKSTDNKSEWRTTQGGGLLAGGIGSGLTGQRIKGMLVVDDPFKGPVDAYSEVFREKVDDWFKTVALTRLEGASVFVIHTRWHEDDLIGRLSKREGWKVINLSAIAEKDDPLNRQPGEALWPELYPLKKLEEREEDLGEFAFASLYQGAPRPRGGSVFGEAHYYDPATTSFEGCRLILMSDPAASQRTSADYSAVVVMSIRDVVEDDGRRYIIGYVRYVYREQKTIPAFVRDLLAIQEEWGQTPIGVECVGAFLAIPQMLRELGVERIVEVVPIGDKFTRAQPAAAAWNIGRLLVPAFELKDAPKWLGKFLDECSKFTGVGDAHDDQVDAMSNGWNIAKGPSSIFDAFGPNAG